MATVLLPIPSCDFDPSEVAISWKVLTRLGHTIVFATPDGTPGACDPIMIDGIGLDRWSRIPGLRRIRVFGLMLRANRDGRTAYAEMIRSAEFRTPLRWDSIVETTFDGLLLGGGHRARGMRDYLESPVLQRLVGDFFAADKPVAAICHGVLLASRSLRSDGRSVLYGRKTTALTWSQEKTASLFARVGRPWDPDYYRTYKEAPVQSDGFMSVEAEVTRALAHPGDFVAVAQGAPHYGRKTSGLSRDSATDDSPAWVVQDGNYVSARWPGDAHAFASTFGRVLTARSPFR